MLMQADSSNDRESVPERQEYVLLVDDDPIARAVTVEPVSDEPGNRVREGAGSIADGPRSRSDRPEAGESTTQNPPRSAKPLTEAKTSQEHAPQATIATARNSWHHRFDGTKVIPFPFYEVTARRIVQLRQQVLAAEDALATSNRVLISILPTELPNDALAQWSLAKAGLEQAIGSQLAALDSLIEALGVERPS